MERACPSVHEEHVRTSSGSSESESDSDWQSGGALGLAREMRRWAAAADAEAWPVAESAVDSKLKALSLAAAAEAEAATTAELLLGLPVDACRKSKG